MMLDPLSLLWLTLGAVASVFVSGRWNRAALAWIAPVFLLLYAHAVPSLPAALGIWVAATVATALSHWRVVPVPTLAYPIVVALLTLPFVIPYLVDRWLAPQLPGVVGTLVFPLAWVASEYLGARANPFGTWGSLAYTQAGNRLLVQLVAATGIWGLPFLIAWFASLMAWAVRVNFAWSVIGSGILLYGGVVAAVIGYGLWRIQWKPAKNRSVTVATVGWPEGLIDREQLGRIFSTTLGAEAIQNLRAIFDKIHDHFIVQTREAARAGARIVVWPEASIVVFRDDYPALHKRLQALGRELGIYFLAGVAIVDPAAEKTKFENRALLYGPRGTLDANYIKSTAVPGFEVRYGLRGDGVLPVVKTPYGRVTVAICYDLDFPWLIRQAGRQGADLLLAPASDWHEIGGLHHDAAVFRAIENGMAMVRSARWGISSMVDATGRAVALLDHRVKSSTLLVAELPVGARSGWYARIGDGFAWACIAALAGLVSWVLARGAGLV